MVSASSNGENLRSPRMKYVLFGEMSCGSLLHYFYFLRAYKSSLNRRCYKMLRPMTYKRFTPVIAWTDQPGRLAWTDRNIVGPRGSGKKCSGKSPVSPVSDSVP